MSKMFHIFRNASEDTLIRNSHCQCIEQNNYLIQRSSIFLRIDLIYV